MGYRIISQDSAAGTVHSNSTTETAIGRKLFAAGSLLPGKSYRIVGAARTPSTNGSDTVTMALRFGTSATSASNTSVAASAAVDVANDDIAIVDCTLQVQSTTRAVAHGVISACDAAGTTGILTPFSTILTIAADTAYYLDWTADWSAAHADNDIQSEAFCVVEIT